MGRVGDETEGYLGGEVRTKRYAAPIRQSPSPTGHAPRRLTPTAPLREPPQEVIPEASDNNTQGLCPGALSLPISPARPHPPPEKARSGLELKVGIESPVAALKEGDECQPSCPLTGCHLGE